MSSGIWVYDEKNFTNGWKKDMQNLLTLLLFVRGSPNTDPFSTSPIRKSDTLKKNRSNKIPIRQRGEKTAQVPTALFLLSVNQKRYIKYASNAWFQCSVKLLLDLLRRRSVTE